MTASPRYKRILLKISGEALRGDAPFGIDGEAVHRLAGEIAEVHDQGVEVCAVVGGGNIFRGSSDAGGMERATADYIGMLATVMNAVAMQHALERLGKATRVLSALPIAPVCEPYIRRRGQRHLEKGRIVLFAGGTGNPFFTTDTAAALRAAEMGCDALLKGTKVDGVYAADPEVVAGAERFERLSYLEVLSKDLKAMDASAISLARENDIPIVVFSIREKGGLAAVLAGDGPFTVISD
ncbi:MAG: UMP kinase [Rhodospirillales bacterium]|nr:UMP kinase [Rhodospirillales bacterium]